MHSYTTNIIGAGAIGHLWAYYLSGHCSVNFYARSNRSTSNLEVKSSSGQEGHRFQYRTFDEWQTADLIIICVKAYQLEELGKELKSILSEKCPVILMMNGLGLEQLLKKYLTENPIFHAYLTHGAYLTEPSLVHAGEGITSIGSLGSKNQPASIIPLIDLLDSALPPVSWSETHNQDMHLKILINAVINPLTAISGMPNGSILKDNKLNDEAQSLFNELSPLFNHLLSGMTSLEVQSAIEKVAHNTAKNQSSMLQDIKNNRKTEIEFINGYLVAEANKLKIDMPLNISLINQIKTLEQKNM